jgi:flagellar hook-associated protein 2
MGAPPISFVGISKFSENFQTILERTFTVANLPVKNLESDRSLIGDRKSELGKLATDLRALRDVFASLGTLGAAGLTNVSTSDANVALGSSTGSPAPIELDVEVTSQATKARETALTGLGDSDATPLAADGIYKLTLGGTTTTIDLSASAEYDNTLAGLRDALNAGDYGVEASILNLSDDPEAPDYRLSIAAESTGAQTLKLTTSADADLLTTENQGTNAVFTVNGVAVTNSGNTIEDFAPGLSLTIVGPGEAAIQVGDDSSTLKVRLTEFAEKYNAVVSRVHAHIGEAAGVLSGDILIREAQAALRAITGFSGVTENVRAIAELGLELDDQGALSFDASRFDQLALSDFEAIREFVGSTTTGFAGNAYGRLGDLADPVTGRIHTAIGFLEESDLRLAGEIMQLEERIDLAIANLEERFGAADTLLAQLESQQSLLARLFETDESD